MSFRVRVRPHGDVPSTFNLRKGTDERDDGLRPRLDLERALARLLRVDGDLHPGLQLLQQRLHLVEEACVAPV